MKQLTVKILILLFFSCFLSKLVYADPKTPVAEFRFDETIYTGAAGEVVDSISGLNGQAFSTQPSAGKVCNAADLRATGTSDYIKLSNAVLQGKKDFTISLWAKTSKTSAQSLVSGANSNTANELIMWFTNHTSFQPFLKGRINGSVNVGTIADNNWHHLVWTRKKSKSCLYKDAVFQGCVNQSKSALNIQSLLLGQEQDSVGGGFSSSQAFDGLIDELLIFNKAIKQTDITTIYNNQNAGLGYDGSTRTCPPKQTYPPVLDMHFDELSWSGSNAVKDSSGNNYHGTAINTQPTSGLLCNAADLSASGISDYITINSGALDTRADFSISVWLKTPKITNQSLLSGSVNSSMNELILWFTGDTWFKPHLNNTSAGTVTTSSIGDNNWHHLVWTRSGTQNCLYRDKVFQGCTSLNSTPLSITSLILGQEQDTLGGGFDSAQAVEGLIDELLIFRQELTATEISDIYDNQLAGKNYDGSRRSSESCPALPIANYRMDESSWTGTGNEVIDQTGNLNAQAKNGVSTLNSSPAIAGNPGTCHYGSFDGVNDYIQVADNALIDLPTELTVTAWINPKSLPSSGLKTIVSKDDNFEFHLNSSGNIFWWWRTHSFATTNAGITPGNWYHIAITYRSGKQVIYINGVEQASRTYTGNLINNNLPLQIGQDQGFGGRYFDGLIDEVRIYDIALTSSEIASIYNETHTCSAIPTIDHYEITHDGTGLTCDSEAVTVKACLNSSCSLVSSSPTTIDLLGNGVTKATTTFTGTGTVSFNHTVAETLTLSTGNESIAPINATQCISGATASCSMTFANAGFRFLSGAANNVVIPNQVAGATFADTLKIQAVENASGVCKGIFSNNVTINLSQTNVSPTGTAGLNFTSNGTVINKSPSSTALTLSFDANSTATIPNPIYHDAGQIQLSASYSAGTINITGNSNPFWVSPSELQVQATNGTTVLNGASNIASPVHKAGANFSLIVNAKNALGVTTPNYSPGQIQLKLQRTGPTVNGIDGTLTVANNQSLVTALTPSFQNVTLTPFSNGVSTYTAAHYSEVGLINLDAQDSNYGGASIVVPATAINIGRFIPDHFKQTVNLDGSFTATCQIPNTFAYSGQTDSATNTLGAISYLTNPEIDITAYNALGGKTFNYSQDVEGSNNDFAKLTASDIVISAPTQDSNNSLALTSNISQGNGTLTYLSGGLFRYKFSDADNFLYLHNATAKIAPFTSAIDFTSFTITDSDSVATTQFTPVTPTGIEIKFGRLVLANSFGPETDNIAQPLSIEYFNGTTFVKDVDSNCVDYNSSNLTLSNISLNPALSGVLASSGTILNGTNSDILLQATGAGNVGEIGTQYSAPSWLQYDWNNNGSYNDNPSAIATFGQFRGNDRVIYRRENYQ